MNFDGCRTGQRLLWLLSLVCIAGGEEPCCRGIGSHTELEPGLQSTCVLNAEGQAYQDLDAQSLLQIKAQTRSRHPPGAAELLNALKEISSEVSGEKIDAKDAHKAASSLEESKEEPDFAKAAASVSGDAEMF